MAIHATLTIKVAYENATDATRDEIKHRLRALADTAANRGLFTGDGPLVVEEWSASVSFES